MWTGEERILAAGESGSRLSTDEGCHWGETLGLVDARTIVDLYQPAPGSTEVLYAVEDSLGPPLALGTGDGGYTSETAGDLGFLGFSLRGMVGLGSVVWVAVADAGGAILLHRSADLGESWEGMPHDLSADPEPTWLVAGAAEEVWLERAGSLWHRTETETLEEHTLPADPEGRVRGAIDGSGALWLAAGDVGLHRRSPDGVWTEVRSEPATVVVASAEGVLVGVVAQAPGDPLVVRSTDGGATFEGIFAAPPSWSYGSSCASLRTQICSPDGEAWLAALGIAPAAVEADLAEGGEDEESGGGGGGCAAAERARGTGGEGAGGLILSIAALGALGLLGGGRRRRRSLSPAPRCAR